MKRIMSVGELKRFYEGRSPGRILFCTDNQRWNQVENPMKAILVFTYMVVDCNPNIICLKNGDSMIYFERVKSIKLDADTSPLGTVLDVVCGDKGNKENDVHYTLIAS